MQIRDLKQDQCKRSVNTGSNELYKHDQSCRWCQNTQACQKDGLDHNSLNFKW